MNKLKFFTEEEGKQFKKVADLQAQVQNHSAQASKCFSSDNFSAAEALIKKCITLLDSMSTCRIIKTYEVQLRSLLGLTYYLSSGNLSKSLQQFQHCLMIDPCNPTVLKRKGQVLFKHKEYSQALDNLKEYNIFQPEDKEVSLMIKQIETALKEESNKPEAVKIPQIPLVRFGSFEVIEISSEMSDEVDARILKGVHGLSSKSKKSILKDNSSAASFTDEPVKEVDPSDNFLQKVKQIDKVWKKTEQAPSTTSSPLLKKSTSTKEPQEEELPKFPKKSLKKSKSVSFRPHQEEEP